MPPLPFGHLPTGETVAAHRLVNATGGSVKILTYGGIVTSWIVPDAHGAPVDIVLGFDCLDGYLAPHPYFGAIAGRVAGRITAGRFSLDGITYHLAFNNHPNHLHGGLRGFDKHLWNATAFPRPQDGAPSLRLSRLSPDGEEGYPGNVTVSVTYTLTDDHTLLIESEASTDRATPFSLTHHSYFNLAGEGSGSVADHTLQILADAYAPTDADLTLLGRREPVTAANDFRAPRRLGDVMPGLHQRHGDLYFLPPPATDKPRLSAVLADPRSGRSLLVQTTEGCLQLYVASSLNGALIGKSGRPYGRHAGVCLECEGYPDGPNTPALGDIILRPGHTARQTTAYSFKTYTPKSP